MVIQVQYEVSHFTNNQKLKCSGKIHLLSQKFIDSHKKEALIRKAKTTRKTRQNIWNLQYKNVALLLNEFNISYKIYRHYMSFSFNELGEFSRNYGSLFQNKTFYGSSINNFGKVEAEYWTITDTDNNVIRRPFWTYGDDVKSLLEKLDNNYLKTSEYDEHNIINKMAYLKIDANRPLRRNHSEDIGSFKLTIPTAEPDNIKMPIFFGKPMYEQLDKAKYAIKVVEQKTLLLSSLDLPKRDNEDNEDNEGKEDKSVDELIVTSITNYMENPLLYKVPNKLYTKKVFTYKNKRYINLYDSEDNLMETVVKYGISTAYFEDWIIKSVDIVTTVHSTINDGLSTFISLFVKKADEYTVKIDENNQALVKIRVEDRPVIDGFIGYKAAIKLTGEPCLVELIIPKSAKVASSSQAAGKFRANKVVPVRIYDVSFKNIDDKIPDNMEIQEMTATLKLSTESEAKSCVYHKADNFIYKIGEEVSIPDRLFCPYMDEICKPGIHYCMTKKEALEFHFKGLQVLTHIKDD